MAQQRVQRHRRNKMEEKIKKSEEKKHEEATEKLISRDEKIKEPAEKKVEEKKDKEKIHEQKPKEQKTEAIARGTSYPISKKHSMYICNMIKNKKIDTAILALKEVINFKRSVRFKGEIPHRKNASGPGRYPINAAGHIINLLKALKGNSIANNLDIDKTIIYYASASWASRPARSGGRAAKRTNIILKAKESKEI